MSNDDNPTGPTGLYGDTPKRRRIDDEEEEEEEEASSSSVMMSSSSADYHDVVSSPSFSSSYASPSTEPIFRHSADLCPTSRTSSTFPGIPFPAPFLCPPPPSLFLLPLVVPPPLTFRFILSDSPFPFHGVAQSLAKWFQPPQR